MSNQRQNVTSAIEEAGVVAVIRMQEPERLRAVIEALAFMSAIAYCAPTQSRGAILTAAPTLNPSAVFAPCSTVTVAVSPPLEGNASDASNVLAPVCAPTLAEISTRGCAGDWAAAGRAPNVATTSIAADHEIAQGGRVISEKASSSRSPVVSADPRRSSPG